MASPSHPEGSLSHRSSYRDAPDVTFSDPMTGRRVLSSARPVSSVGFTVPNRSGVMKIVIVAITLLWGVFALRPLLKHLTGDVSNETLAGRHLKHGSDAGISALLPQASPVAIHVPDLVLRIAPSPTPSPSPSPILPANISTESLVWSEEWRNGLIVFPPPLLGDQPPPLLPAQQQLTSVLQLTALRPVQAGNASNYGKWCAAKWSLCKYDPDCASLDSTYEPNLLTTLLVTGVGGSGTVSTLDKLRYAGFSLGAEVDGHHGAVAWPARCDGTPNQRAFMSGGAFEVGWKFFHYRFRVMAHQVRHPLNTIASYLHFTVNMETRLNRRVWAYIEAFTDPLVLQAVAGDVPEVVDWHKPFRNASRSDGWAHPIFRAALHWLSWNAMVEQVADFRYRVEDDMAIPELCVTLVKASGPSSFQSGTSTVSEGTCRNILEAPLTSDHHTHGGSRRRRKVTWEALSALSPTLAKKVWEMAQRYGYERVPPKRRIESKSAAALRKRKDDDASSGRRKVQLRVPGARVSSSQDPFAKHWPELVLDGVMDSYFWTDHSGETGDHIVITLPEPININTLKVAMGIERHISVDDRDGGSGWVDAIDHALLQIAPTPSTPLTDNSEDSHPSEDQDPMDLLEDYCTSIAIETGAYVTIAEGKKPDYGDEGIMAVDMRDAAARWSSSPTRRGSSSTDSRLEGVQCIRLAIATNQKSWFGVREIEFD